MREIAMEDDFDIFQYWQTTTVWPKNVKIEHAVETKTPTLGCPWGKL